MIFTFIVSSLYYEIHSHGFSVPILRYWWNLYHRFVKAFTARYLLTFIIMRLWKVVLSKNFQFLSIKLMLLDLLLKVVIVIDDEWLKMGRLETVVSFKSLRRCWALVWIIFFLLRKTLNLHQWIIITFLQLLWFSQAF